MYRTDYTTRWSTGFGAGPAPPWDIDSTSNKGVPSSLAQWTALISAASLSIAEPDSLYLCQEASGNLTDTIGGRTMVPNASPLYSQTVTGWTRKGVAVAGGASQRFLASGYPNASTTSILLMMYVGFTTAPGSATTIAAYGTSDDASITSGSTGQRTWRYREGANINQMTGTYTEPTIYPVCLRRNVTGTSVLFTSDTEKVVPTYGAAAATTNLTLGAPSGTASQTAYVYVAVWTGANAEAIDDAELKSLLQQLGWTITWT